MTEEDVCAFVQRSIGSVWALELLFLLWRGRVRAWTADELVRDLRSSHTIVRDALAHLAIVGLVREDAEGWRFAPATPAQDEAVSELQALYAAKPATVIRVVLSAPNEKLRIFSDAFKFRE